MTTKNADMYAFNVSPQRRVLYALAALVTVLAAGTIGFAITQEEWGFWRSLYFTVITITTVGYGDYGLSPTGERFATFLLIFGLAAATYAFGQLAQATIFYQLAWSRRMQKKIDHLRDHFIVCGAGRVGKTVCERLTRASMPFVVIERSDVRFDWCREHGFLAIHGIASEDHTLLQAGIERARGIVCAVDSDSENIVITLGARELNPIITIIARVDAEDTVRKMERAGASSVVSPALRGGHDIADLLIRPHLTELLSQSHDAEGGYHLSEVTIDEHSALIGQTLLEYGTQEPDVVFVAIKRAGTARTRPLAAEVFKPGDTIIIAGDREAVQRMRRDAAAVPAYA